MSINKLLYFVNFKISSSKQTISFEFLWVLGLVCGFLGFLGLGLGLGLVFVFFVFLGLGLVFVFLWFLGLCLGLVFVFLCFLGLCLGLVFVFFWAWVWVWVRVWVRVWVWVWISTQTQNPSFFGVKRLVRNLFNVNNERVKETQSQVGRLSWIMIFNSEMFFFNLT